MLTLNLFFVVACVRGCVCNCCHFIMILMVKKNYCLSVDLHVVQSISGWLSNKNTQNITWIKYHCFPLARIQSCDALFNVLVDNQPEIDCTVFFSENVIKHVIRDSNWNMLVRFKDHVFDHVCFDFRQKPEKHDSAIYSKNEYFSGVLITAW